MNKISLVLLACACASFASAAGAVELAKYPKVFSAGDGVQVALAPTADGGGALVQVTGINDPIDGVVLLGRLEKRGAGAEEYVATLEGRDYGLVRKDTDSWSGGERYQAFLPGRRDGVALRYDEAGSRQLEPAALQATYDRQKAAGVQDRLARFDRDKRVAEIEAALARIDQAASKACGAPVRTQVQWSSIDEDKLKRLGIAGYCGEIASQLENACSNDAAARPALAGLGQVSCSFGGAIRLREDRGTLRFTTAEDAPNQGDFIQQYLRNR